MYLSIAVINRSSQTTMYKLVTASSQAVWWYLTDDARRRAAALIPLAMESDVRKALVASNKADSLAEIDRDTRDNARKALKAFAESQKDTGTSFDVIWAVDVGGRVVANYNYDHATVRPGFEMGGYSVVADAIHGWIRDDAWVLNETIYRVVARPVEHEVNAAPVGAIVGAKVVDDGFARSISAQTGAAVAFYAGGQRVATGVPSSFDRADLEVTTADIASLEDDANYQEKGATAPRILRESVGWRVGAIFARMPGEAWDMGAGYVVGHRHPTIQSPFEFERLTDQKDMEELPTLWIGLLALGAALLGVLFTVFEHTLPLHKFGRALAELGKGGVDVLKPATFRWKYKKLAQHVNDGLDKVAAASGVERGPADLESVLGPLPAKPQMSAFSVPDSGPGETPKPAESESQAPARKKVLPRPPSARDEASQTPPPSAGAESATPSAEVPAAEPAPGAVPAAQPPPASAPVAVPEADVDEEAPTMLRPSPLLDQGLDPEEIEWRRVYAEFIASKKRLGEPIETLTYEKFRGTLQRNKEALMARHQCRKVKFRVYEKEGKTALKASPIK